MSDDVVMRTSVVPVICVDVLRDVTVLAALNLGAVRQFPDDGKCRRDRGRPGWTRRGAVAVVAGIPADDLREGSDAGRAVDGASWPEWRVADDAHQHQSRDDGFQRP